jgi:CzcA family heavy metal efflux pump
MLNRIISFSLNNRLIVLMGAVLLMVAGLYTSKTMEVDVFPDLNAPTVVVMTEANGMAAEEVERLVTFPIETSVNGATGVKRVRSSSTNGFSILWVEFDWGTDIYLARQIVSEKLAMVTESLPDGIGNPTLGPQSSILGELMIVSLTSDSIPMEELRTMADWVIRPRLLATGGVAQVAVLGGDVKEYQILLNPERMKYASISLDEVLFAVRGMNTNATGGVLYEYGNEYIIRGVLSTNSLDELSRSIVKKRDDQMIMLGDIAEIKIGPKAPQTGLASYGTKPAVLLTVTKQPNVSTLDLTDKIDRSIEDLKKSIPASVEIKTDAFRQSRFIESSIHNIQSSLFEGAIFVVLVLMLFLMNVRTTVISLVTIPLSLLFTLLVMYFLGMTINTMSIGGMAIAIGSLVDDAIVDVENVYKRLRENSLKPLENRLPIIKVVYEASKEVRMPILNSTMIIVVSFVPLFFLSGMEGRMLQPLGIAFIIALFSSTLVALTVTPVLCSYLLKKENSAASKEAKFSLKLRSVYQKALNWSLENGRVVLTSALVAFVVALILFFNFGRSFLPSFNEGSLTINVSTIPGVSLEVSEELGRQAEEILLTIPEIQTVSRKTGRAELDEHALGVNVSEIEAPFELSDRSKEEMIKEVRHKMSHIPGVAVEIGQPISHRIDAMLSGTRANIAIKIFGSDLNQLFQLGNQIKREISGVEGIADLNVEQQIERPQLKIIPRRDLLVRYGIPLSEFREYVEVLLGGEVVSQVYEGDKTFDLTIKVRDESRDGIEKIRNILIDTNEGKIPLGYVADVVSASGPNLINRENVSRKVVVSANVADRDLRSVVDDIQKCVDEKIHLPEGYHVEYGGQFESEQAASRILLFTCLLSVLVIFLLLYNQFKSATQSLVILLNLPLALIGGAVAIALTGGVMSIPSIIGFISLFGIATRNGMLLVDRYNELCKEGLSLHETIVKGSLDRLNPILMTALSSALAMIPLAIGGDLPGNEIQSPMAIVILGGLFSSTFLNAFVIPIVYMKMKNRF